MRKVTEKIKHVGKALIEKTSAGKVRYIAKFFPYLGDGIYFNNLELSKIEKIAGTLLTGSFRTFYTAYSIVTGNPIYAVAANGVAIGCEEFSTFIHNNKYLNRF